MRWMEQAAYIAASRVGRGGRHLLTASMDSIAFRHPTRVGDILYVSAQVFCHFITLCDITLTPMSIKSVPPASAVAPASCPARWPLLLSEVPQAQPGATCCGSLVPVPGPPMLAEPTC